jgi:hypothetical protein
MGYAPIVDSSGNVRPFEATMINKSNFERETLDVKQTASKLGVCDETIRRMVRRRAIAKVPGIRRVLIPIQEVERILVGTAVEPSANLPRLCVRESLGGVG